MTHVSARRGAFYVSMAATAWGTGGAAGSLLFQTGQFGPVGVSLWRHLLGAAFLLLIVRRLVLADHLDWRVLPVGAGMAVYQTAYFAAIAHSGVAVATVVTMGATPVLTAVGSRLFLRERLTRGALLALAAALAGLVLLTVEPALATSATPAVSPVLGVAFALASATGYAGVTLVSRRHKDRDPRTTAIGGFAVAAVCLAPFALADGVVPELSWPSLALLVYLGAVPTALAYGLYFVALTVLRATTVAIISLGEAVGAALLGVALFGERLTPLAWTGCALLLAAVTVLAVRADAG
ncbi:EamA/RhaT family transporter [Nonomuraea sp. KC401]|uniref:DMT family transporter n=1 Tax=unclassified Nonomuraea TaxID=2593643 RepID=UPI0010FE6E3C|nr:MULTISPECIES: EamA family transporter [unclassified Nonomuraea]NBE97849.1 EamA family transporter [Nonomuraea sp. K271]TLF63022.1 EamA/RhaT family transporter [Nonomuraea sp. KC401]